MIIRVLDEKRANFCDILLTKLIQDEKKYDDYCESIIVKDYFKNVIKNKDNILMVYEEDDIIKGYIYLKPCSDNKGYLIDGLYVEEEYRNNNIAKQLINEAVNTVKDNITYIDLNVLSKNKVAYELYKSLGFVDYKISLKKIIKKEIS